MNKKLKQWIFSVVLFLSLLSLDAVLKKYTIVNIAPISWLYPHYPFGGIGIFENFLGISFSLNYVSNLGAAWGLFSAYSSYLILLRVAIVLALFSYLIFFNQDKKQAYPLFLISVGAVGNILDFILYGHVVDMFHFVFWGYSFPIFNLADAMVCIGIFWMVFFHGKFFSNKQRQSA